MGFFQSGGMLNRRGFFGGTAAFSPKDISGLQLWLDATAGLFDATSGGNAVTADGSAVARWEDQSGNARHATQATSGNRAALKTSVQNSKNVIRFDGTDDFYSGLSAALVNTTGTNKFSFYIAWIPDLASRQSAYGGGGILRKMTNGGSGDTDWYFGVRSGGRFAINITGGANKAITSTTSLTTNTSYVVGLTYDGTASTTVSNRVKLYLGTTEETKVLDDGSGGWGNGDGELGRGYTSSSYYFKGDACEIIVYDSVLSSDNRTKVSDYLKSKWGIS
ncbi:MAG: hypothetical protein EBR82_79750 [Caulobacteraceae bacterium]|nr:hypothetical protein [Caulobacteraceae bacterium]